MLRLHILFFWCSFILLHCSHSWRDFERKIPRPTAACWRLDWCWQQRWPLPGLHIPLCLIFHGLPRLRSARNCLSATNLIAATAIIRRLGVPDRIQVILEGESLVNDATALVALQFAISAWVTGTYPAAYAALWFVWAAAWGIGIGLLVGVAMCLDPESPYGEAAHPNHILSAHFIPR